MNYYDNAGVERILLKDIRGYYKYLFTRLHNILHQHAGAWAIVEPKNVYNDPLHQHGDIRTMTCFTDKAKVVKVISTNPFRTKNPSVSVGATLLLDHSENYPVCIYDAPAMSGIRTAAMAVLAMDINYPYVDPANTLIVGRGRVGRYTDIIMNTVWPNIRTDVWDERDGARANGFKGYEVVITATDSKEPFISTHNCDANLVISVGADTHFNRELRKNFMVNRRNLYVDTWSAHEVGDLEALAVKRAVRGDLYLMIEKKDADCFISVGSPLMDALTVEYLYEHG